MTDVNNASLTITEKQHSPARIIAARRRKRCRAAEITFDGGAGRGFRAAAPYWSGLPNNWPSRRSDSTKPSSVNTTDLALLTGSQI